MNPRVSTMLEKMKAHRLSSTLLILLTLTIGILIGTVISKNAKGKEIDSSDAAPLQVAGPQQLSNAFATVAKEMEPSVVNINTESTIKPSRRRAPGQGGDQGDDNDLQDFFDRFFGGQGGQGGRGPMGPPQGMRERALGSGVIMDAKGYIVTNNHVVEKADRIRVKLQNDNTQYEAKVIGTDPETDLAVIKIEPKGKSLTAAKLGNSESMNVGDWVLAIGSPFGLEETVTAGIVSAKTRDIDPTHQFQRFIQTDAAINPGNSGGPLVNMAGQVVGINTAIFTQSMGYQGVGFALPSDTVAAVYNQLIGPEHKVTRGSIGVSFNATPNPAIARVYGVSKGVTIASVNPDGPAKNAGLQVGDTITAVNGKPVNTGDELVNAITAVKPGDKAHLSVIRNGKETSSDVTVVDRNKLYGESQNDETGDETQPTENKMGLTVGAVTPDLADRLGVTAGKGVVVRDVRPGSFAEDIGLSRGDVILEVNKQPVNGEEQFRKLQGQLKSGEDVVFLVQQGRGQGGGTIFLGGTLP
jgi:serine protease Do